MKLADLLDLIRHAASISTLIEDWLMQMLCCD